MAHFGHQMSHDLVTVEIKIDPLISAAAFLTAKPGAVKLTGKGEIMDWKSQMERAQGHAFVLIMLPFRGKGLHASFSLDTAMMNAYRGGSVGIKVRT
jgi:hypothetical protein